MLFIIVVIAIFAGLVTRKAWQVRRVSRIAVHPHVEELARDRAPRRLRRFLAEVEPQLLAMGFHALEDVCRIKLRDSLFWTGILFINSAMDEFVSVCSWGAPNDYKLAIGWITQFTNGHKVTTRWTPAANSARVGGVAGIAGREPPILVDVRAWHRRRVEQAIAERKGVGEPTPPGRVLPVRESESQRSRSADQMAAEVASSLGWRIGVSGRYYEPSWREAFRRAFGGPRTEKQHGAHGFEVVVTPRQTMPVKVDAIPDETPES